MMSLNRARRRIDPRERPVLEVSDPDAPFSDAIADGRTPTGTAVTLFDSGSMIATELGATTDPPPDPCPRAKTGMATAAASTPINAVPAYMRRRLRVSSTSSVFSWPNLLAAPR